MDEAAIKREIELGFEYSYQHDDWITPLDEALKGVGVPEALWRATPKGKCIWEIVLHMAAWNEDIVTRIDSRSNSRPPDGNWPPLPEHADGDSWEASKDRLWNALSVVEETIRTKTLDELQAGPYGLADLLCRLTHNGYHLGQIEKLKEFMAFTNRHNTQNISLPVVKS